MEENHNINSYRFQLDKSRQILLLVDSVEAKDRIHALEVLGQLLKDIVRDSEHEVSSSASKSLKISISYSILTRCDDISPEVRTKALNILSQTIVHILNILNENKEFSSLDIESIEDVNEMDLDINGNHRYFWYLLTSVKGRRKELIAVLRRRTSDHYVAARKAAFSALANAMMFDPAFITPGNVRRLKSSATDVSAVIRKQAIQLFSALLEACRTNHFVQELWLMCVLPLTEDFDASVASKALSAFEDAFLRGTFSPQSTQGEISMVLLKTLSSGEFLPYQKFLKSAFGKWKSTNKLEAGMIEQLKAYIGTGWEECVWFYVSNFASHCAIPRAFACLGIECLRGSQRTKEYPPSTAHVLEALSHIFRCLPPEMLDEVHAIIRGELEAFSVPTEFIPMYIDLLCKIHKHKDTKAEFDAFSTSVIQVCLKSLVEAQSKELAFRSHTEEFFIKLFCTMSELCLIYPSHVATTLVAFLKKCSACTGSTETKPEGLSSKVQAHALAALGKICLLDQSLALELMPVFGQKLLTSKEDVIRNNASIILADLCKCYPPFADMCIPFISQSFNDNVYLIRYQTILLLTSLLQDDNILIRWQHSLFFGLLSTLVDKTSRIRKISQYTLCQLLRRKSRSLFFDCFIDSVFVLNCFAPPDNERITQLVEKSIQFSMPGEKSRDKRMLVYRFLLLSMSVKEKAQVVGLICGVMMNVAQSVYPLNQKTECLIRDCFAILSCYEIRIVNLDDFESADDVSTVVGTELLSRRLVIVNPVISAIGSLKNVVGESDSNIVRDMIMFVKGFLSDFMDDIKDILAEDKILLKQMEYEMKKDAEVERRNCQARKESLQSMNNQPESNRCTATK